MKIRVGETSGSGTCPLCKAAVEEAATRTCPDCGIDYHGACLAELGSCVTPGCDWGETAPEALSLNPRSALMPFFAATALAVAVMIGLQTQGLEPERTASFGFVIWLVALWGFERVAHRSP